MARARAKLIHAVDATPERLSKGDASDYVNPALIDDTEQPIGLVRRFKSSYLDRLYIAHKIDDRQYNAGVWYQRWHHKASFTLSVIANYGERTTKGEPGYGLARTRSQLHARQLIADARSVFTQPDMMDRLLAHDETPRVSGRAFARMIKAIGDDLNLLADWIA